MTDLVVGAPRFGAPVLDTPDAGVVAHPNRRGQFAALAAELVGILLGSLDQTIGGTAIRLLSLLIDRSRETFGGDLR